MRVLSITILILCILLSCTSTRQGNAVQASEVQEGDTIRIANDSLEYEITIIEPGFNFWLQTRPPRGYYGLQYLERKNKFWVLTYNRRSQQPTKFGDLYQPSIPYEIDVEYGYEVNYMLFNYLVYFQEQYNQKL